MMRNVLLCSCAILCGIGVATAFLLPEPEQKFPGRLLGAKECTWGPSYWCSNLTAAAGCKAVPHCIQTVWVHQNPPPDTDSICQICVKMVTQARDQLESNETQDELKQVFEGSCKLIPLKVISSECCKLADEFIPELVETLASQMNPQVVCSVAGLCNNARIDALLEEAEEQPKISFGKAEKVVNGLNALSTCDGCHAVVDIVEKKFKNVSSENLLNGFLSVCARMSSLSDGCTNIILNNFHDIQNFLKENLNAEEVCLMSGECSAQFHVHADVQPLSSTGFVPIDGNDDIPCKLCEQLVGHLRDLLVANTTELEFQKVLEGLCKQMKTEFKSECLSITNEYYPMIYNFLISELNASALCGMIGICPAALNEQNIYYAPLLPTSTVAKMEKIMNDKVHKFARVQVTKADSTVRISESTRPVTPIVQLPIERISPQTLTLIGNTEMCTLCEYLLHYVQQAITQPATEEEIKEVVGNVCKLLPKSVNASCHDFVNTYGEAMVAILAQEIDPSQVCPMLSLCPSAGSHDVEVFMSHYGGVRDKSSCPLCLFAVEELESLCKENKTKQHIKDALGKLCSHFSQNLKQECADFVGTYTDELVEMLMADFNPQEVCVYLKLCNDSTPAISGDDDYLPIIYGGSIATNEIPDSTSNGKTLITAAIVDKPTAKPECVICEFIMNQLESELKDNKTDEEIKNAVLNVCKHLPRTIGKECTDFVNTHGEQIIQLLTTLAPNEICRMMSLCQTGMSTVKAEVHFCGVCEAAVSALDKLLQNPNIDHKIETILEKACHKLKLKYRNECENLIETYGEKIFDMLTHVADPSTVCTSMELCGMNPVRHQKEPSLGAIKCTWGPGYWCQSPEHAQGCGLGAVQHCQEKVWKTDTQERNKRDVLVGQNKCTYGPSYWCVSLANAQECGEGAKSHCRDKVWKGAAP